MATLTDLPLYWRVSQSPIQETTNHFVAGLGVGVMSGRPRLASARSDSHGGAKGKAAAVNRAGDGHPFNQQRAPSSSGRRSMLDDDFADPDGSRVGRSRGTSSSSGGISRPERSVSGDRHEGDPAGGVLSTRKSSSAFQDRLSTSQACGGTKVTTAVLHVST